jgi:hypothetical protein
MVLTNAFVDVEFAKFVKGRRVDENDILDGYA